GPRRVRAGAQAGRILASCPAREGMVGRGPLMSRACAFGVGCALLVCAPGFAAAPPRGRRDRHGDALPAGAVARLGTSRDRGDWSLYPFVLAPDGRTLLTVESPEGPGEDEEGAAAPVLVSRDLLTGKATSRVLATPQGADGPAVGLPVVLDGGKRLLWNVD